MPDAIDSADSAGSRSREYRGLSECRSNGEVEVLFEEYNREHLAREAAQLHGRTKMALDLKLRAAFHRSIRCADAAAEAGGDPSQKLRLAEEGRKNLDTAVDLLWRAREQVGRVASRVRRRLE